MELVNKIKTGIHLDNNIYDQPENSMRDNLNGVIINEGGGLYKWRNIKGNTLSFTISANDKYFSHCTIRDRLIIITLDDSETWVKFWEIIFVGDTGTANLRNQSANTTFNFSFDFPITAIWGFYENEETQRIYLTDNNNQPRCINIGNSETIVINEKFTSFAPVINHVYGKFVFQEFLTGGNLKAGNYFFAWRYYTSNGYYSDWSQLSNPISTYPITIGSTFRGYQDIQGAAPNEVISKMLKFRIDNIDSDYESIQVCAFYSNDYNTAEPGVIFWDGGIHGNSYVDIVFKGSENFGSVVLIDLIQTSIVIERCKDMLYAKKKNVISNIKERSELDVSSLNSEHKNNYLPATIAYFRNRILLDTSGYPNYLFNSLVDKGLFGTKTFNVDAFKLRKGFWYKAIDEVLWHDGGSNYTAAAGTVFYVSELASNPTWDSGNLRPAIVIRKYLKTNHALTGDITHDTNNCYEIEVTVLNNDYFDFKSPKVSLTMRGYPQGETIRLGVLFFDLTGRPFFIRHLRDITYGDITLPKTSSVFSILELFDKTSDANGDIYGQVNGLVTGLKISGLDITDVVNQISGFMIVRCPIIRQYLGMGILHPTYQESNNVYSYPRMVVNTGQPNFPGCYDFICPEDIFNLKDFVLQKTDKIENLMFLNSFSEHDSYTIGGDLYETFGRRETENGRNFYHKFYIYYPHTHMSNASLGASHEIIAVTKYEIGDDKLPIKPTDLTKLYQSTTSSYSTGGHSNMGTPGTHSILIFDIDETSGNLKGTDTFVNIPTAFLCAVKRENSDPYGGSSDSALANSVYMSTGHFQEINSTVLASIVNNGRYVFNGIEIFGGDTFVNLFDYKRIYVNEESTYHNVGQTIIFPVESRINLALREGAHVARNRTHDGINNPAGIRMKVGSNMFEEFNYNDGYSSDNLSDLYLPVPFDYKFTNEYDVRIRYSVEKNYGEKQDKFLSFGTNDLIDLDSNQGPITNIRYKQNKLVYWQEDEVGYIPIGERTLTQNSVGQAVQIGIGGIFERYDQLVDRIGNGNHFGLVESPIGYHWYDAKRKLFFTMDYNMKLSPESVLKGIDSFFQTIPVSFMTLDNPQKDYGAFGGYDPMSKMVFYTFYIDGSTKKTIGISTLLNQFTGFYNIYPRAYMTYKDNLFQGNATNKSLYIHGKNILYQNFFGIQYDAYLTLIIKEPTNEAKSFDIFELIGNANIFTSIVFSNSDQSVEEVIASYTDGVYTLLNRNYDYKKRRWLGNYPKVNRERLTDGYLQVKFKISDPVLVELMEFRSTVRKIF